MLNVRARNTRSRRRLAKGNSCSPRGAIVTFGIVEPLRMERESHVRKLFCQLVPLREVLHRSISFSGLAAYKGTA